MKRSGIELNVYMALIVYSNMLAVLWMFFIFHVSQTNSEKKRSGFEMMLSNEKYSS
jgi:hypothetical protein